MAITGIGDARTPANPIENTFAVDTGQPTATQEIILIGHEANGGGTVDPYVVTTISNSGDADAAAVECRTKFGGSAGSDAELTKMVVAAIKANAGASSYPQIKAVPLTYGSDTAASNPFGASDAALTAIRNTKGEFIVGPHDGVSGSGMSPAATKLKAQALLVSGATRTSNNQFGTFAVVFNRSVDDPANLPAPDSQYLVPVWLYDSGSPDYSIGEMGAAAAAVMAANPIPFNPLDDTTLQNVDPPADSDDWPTVGDNAESETALQKGWTPLYVKPNEEVAFVRTITSRLSVDGTGTPVVGSYYDVQDFQVLYYWRKAEYTLLKQFKKKASAAVATRIKGALINLAIAFEEQEMFQAVAQLAKQFIVQRASTDRHAFEIKTPVNVVPGLHRKKANTEATTEFDTIVV